MPPEFTPQDIERFWSKVDIGAPDDCWEWRGRCHPYGNFQWGGKRGTFRRAHRVAYFLTYGEWPEETHHRCKNKPCVNPSHLESVSPRMHGERHRWPTCAHGHDLSPDNVYIITEQQKGYPVARCRQCRIDAGQRYRETHPKPKAIDPANRGTKHHSSKLAESDVYEIRRRYAQGGITLKHLAAEYGVAFSGISAIVRRKSWKNLPSVDELRDAS